VEAQNVKPPPEDQIMNTTRIAVAGATGRAGRHVVDTLEARGHEVVQISRAQGVDVITGEGLDRALEGVAAIVDAATGPSPDEREATEFFTTATRNLQAAGERAGVQRIVVVSIIGIDKLTAGYNVAKLAHEQRMLAGPVPARILRASQFHEFVGQLMDWGRRNGAIQVPEMRTQPVAARTVGEALADLATSDAPEAAGAPIPEIAGPRAEILVELARRYAAHRGENVAIEAVADPSDPDAAAVASGALLPSPHATLAGPTFEEWLSTAA
jgi:uncharacterized protein YbjT (DUF2867 family)